MSYSHIQYEVDMIANRAMTSDVTAVPFGVRPCGGGASLVGAAIWSPVFMPHRIVAVGVFGLQTPTQLAAVSNQPNFWFAQCVTANSATVAVAASNVFAKLTLPTTVTGGGAQNRSYIHYVTAQVAGGGPVIIKPGQVVKMVMPCGDVAGAGIYLPKLLVEPVWGLPGSIVITPSTGTSTTLAMIDIKQPTGYDGVA